MNPISRRLTFFFMVFGLTLSVALPHAGAASDKGDAVAHRLHDLRGADRTRTTGSRLPKTDLRRIREALTGLSDPVAAPSENRVGRVGALDAAGGSAAGFRVRFDRRTGIPVFLKLKTPRRGPTPRAYSPARSRNKAVHFLVENRDLLKLADPASELIPQRQWRDDAGMVHIRYRQTFRNIPLWGREAALHLDAAGDVFLFQGGHAPTPETVETTPILSPDAAVDIVRERLGMTGDGIEPPDVERVIHTDPNGNHRLAYKVETFPALDRRWRYFVDARTGAVLGRNSRVASELATAGDDDLIGEAERFTVWREDGNYFLVDPTVPLDDPPYDPVPAIRSKGNTYVFDARNGDGDIHLITSDRRDGGWDPAGVSVANHIAAFHDYYRRTFGRNGLDDANLNYLAVVHLLEDYSNAFWNGKFVVFGDGDGRTFGPLAAGLDIAAHELQHGVTQFSTGLIYENQSGALTEALSDIFACMVDRDDWTMGEDVVLTAPGYLRNLADPSQGLTPLPTRMSEYRNLPNTESGDWGGVHVNMSIPARAAYLMAEGLTAEGLGTGIGRSKTERIFYRAMTTYLQAASRFLDARFATLQAAEDLYGPDSPEVAAAAAAWDAVEVFDDAVNAPADSTHTPAMHVDGQDLMLYLSPAAPDVYALHFQSIPRPFTGYDPSLDSAILNRVPALRTRPAAVTLAEGTLFFYVGIDGNLYGVLPDGGDHRQLTTTGDIFSFTISPRGRFFAYTSIFPEDNNIYVGDLDADTLTEYPVRPPTDLPPGQEGGINTILFADSLAFDYTGNRIVFDALNCIDTAADPCSIDSGHRYWSIGILELTEGAFEFPFTNQDTDINVAYPAFAYNNDFVIVMDEIDETAAASGGPIRSRVTTLNRLTRTRQVVADPAPDTESEAVYGVPSFWGGDDNVTIQATFGLDSFAYRVPVTDDWSGTPSEADRLNPNPIAMPLMHRAGTRDLSDDIQADPAAVDFGTASPGQTLARDIALTNTGNRDIEIRNIAVTGSAAFAHNGVNVRLPWNQSVAFQVFFTPAGPGTYDGAVVVTTNTGAAQIRIPLSGRTASDGYGDSLPPETDSEVGGGGGCFMGIAEKGWRPW